MPIIRSIRREVRKQTFQLTDLIVLLRGLRGIQEGWAHQARLDWQAYLVPWVPLDHLGHRDHQDHRIVVDQLW